MQPYLPHDDPDPARRWQTLELRRRHYFFNYDYIPGVLALHGAMAAEGCDDFTSGSEKISCGEER
jgi:hypothetical protein